MTTPSTIDPSEVEKFSKMATEWWDPNGKFKPLHRLNPVRLEYIRTKVTEHFNLEKQDCPFEGLRLLDVGCGGGLLTEPMRRLGANAVGIDASEKNIKTAQARAEKTGVIPDYRVTSAEALAESEPESFDILLAMEVVEHVADPGLFIASCAKLLKPGGVMFHATLNRTLKSFLFAIIGAEYILGWLPRGTHEYKKFLKPEEVESMLSASGIRPSHLTGVTFNPLTKEWNLSHDRSVNYMGCGVKESRRDTLL